MTDIAWPLPPTLPPGDYVLWVELAEGFDFNATYNATSYPSPTNISYSSYGQPYRGQPSVVYSAAIPQSVRPSRSRRRSITSGTAIPTATTARSDHWRPRRSRPTRRIPVRAARLVDGSSMYRLRVSTPNYELDFAPPDPPAELVTTTVSEEQLGVAAVRRRPATTARSTSSPATSRIRAGDEMTRIIQRLDARRRDDRAGRARHIARSFKEVSGLLPDTDYWINVRAYDDCQNESGITIVKLTTGDQSREVDACASSTAARTAR